MRVSGDRTIHWLWGASRGHRARVALCAVLGILRIAASLAFVWLTKSMVDLATKGPLAADLWLGIGAMLLCVLVQLGSSAARSRLTAKVEIALRNDLRLRLMDHVLKSRWTGREAFHTGDVLNRLEGDASTLSRILSGGVPAVAALLAQLLGSAAFLVVISPWAGLAIILGTPIMLLLSKLYFKKMRHFTKAIRSTDSLLQTYIQENLQHRSLITAFEQGQAVTEGMETLQSGLEDLVMKRSSISVFSSSLVGACFSLGYIIAFGWGVWGIAAGTVTFGALTAFLQLVGMVQRPMAGLGREIPSFVSAMTSAERLKELCSLPLEERGEPILIQGQAGIRLNDVSFSYSDSDSPVLDHFTFDFEPGTLTAVLGETGVGKSTLVRLMLALLEPSSGSLELYSKPRRRDLAPEERKSATQQPPQQERDPEQQAWRHPEPPAHPEQVSRAEDLAVPVSPRTRGNFVYVPQGNSLVSGTIRDNLLLGDPSASDATMWEALHTAAAEFVRSLPLGLDTPCGEQGAGLSEGQAQRIAIARGLLRRGGILLLDEPTSSIDPETERVLMSRLSDSLGGRTLILITHQSRTAASCDRSVRLSHA